MRDDFAVFILTHGRPDKVYTTRTLKRCGYTGKVYIVIDSEDQAGDEYREKFDDVLVFDKADVAGTFDVADNFKGLRGVVYARNVCHDLAEQVGVKYFLVLDDDYTSFSYRFSGDLEYKHKPIRNLDKMFNLYVEFYRATPVLSVAMAQGGDFIGGKESNFANLLLSRKCMNTFFCGTDRPFKFVGRINEDVNTYVALAITGGLFLTASNTSINQVQTQASSGGLTELYLDAGTYVKSFYTIIFSPSSVRVSVMGNIHMRLHHHVSWPNTVPVLLDPKHKKVANGD